MPRLSYSKRAAIRQAIDMQKLCYSAAQLLDQDLRQSTDKEERARAATALGNVVRNWSALQDSVRVLKGDPLPGSYKPKPPKSKPPRAHFDEDWRPKPQRPQSLAPGERENAYPSESLSPGAGPAG